MDYFPCTAQRRDGKALHESKIGTEMSGVNGGGGGGFILDGELLELDEFRNDELVSEEELERQAANASQDEQASHDIIPLGSGLLERGFDSRRAPPPVATGTGLNAVRQMKLTVTKKRAAGPGSGSGKRVGRQGKHGKTVGARSGNSRDPGRKGVSRVGAEDIWGNVEHLLTASGPNIDHYSAGEKSLRKAESRQRRRESIGRSTTPGMGRGGPGIAGLSTSSSTKNTRVGGKDPLDRSLLQEAFAYCESLEEQGVGKISVKEEALLMEEFYKKSAARGGGGPESRGPGPGRRAKGKAGKGRGKVKVKSGGGRRGMGKARERDRDDVGKANNMDALVKNFEQGIELKRLRDALEASQRSQEESRSFISKAASTWFQR